MKDVPAKSGAEASDESILKKDLAAAEAPDDKVDSDKAKAMFAAHEPSPNAVVWSKLAHPTTDPLTAPTCTGVKPALKNPAKPAVEASFDETSVMKYDPALKPVTEVAAALKPAANGGAPLPSIKEFPEERLPAPAASVLHSAPCVSDDTLLDPTKHIHA